MSDREILAGWQEIADAARVSISTAQRLAKTDGLPVLKIRGVIRAKKQAILEWMENRSENVRER